MKINDKILSIPPYISTTWKNVRALHQRGNYLVVNLNDGETIQIPSLTPTIVEQVFQAHAEFIDKEASEQPSAAKLSNPLIQTLFSEGTDSPFKVGFNGLEGLGAPLQHNPENMNAPDIPQPILQKIASIAKVLAAEDVAALAKPEPHCNCMYCQIARTIQNEANGIILPESKEDDTVSEDDLSFRHWDIAQTGDKLFSVINRLDGKEKYSVYLGHPIGCTCGKTGCEHIVAVLKS